MARHALTSLLIMLPLLTTKDTANAAEARPKELGDVRFGRDLDAALARGRAEAKPILILFDEIPGCSTCIGFGETVLRHPLLIEAIEAEVVPVAIHNNAGGADRKALDAFSEPAWNNPVVRIVDADRRMLAPRLSGDYTPAGLARTLVVALEASGRAVPQYLRLLSAELDAEKRGSARATFGMYCFWAGEACLGGLEGVVGTRTGTLEGREAVEVEFDPAKLGYAELLRAVKGRSCATTFFPRTDAEVAAARQAGFEGIVATQDNLRSSPKDDKYNLASTPFARVPMTPLQATRANTLIASGGDARSVLSPRQLEILTQAARDPTRGVPDGFRGGDLRVLFAKAR